SGSCCDRASIAGGSGSWTLTNYETPLFANQDALSSRRVVLFFRRQRESLAQGPKLIDLIFGELVVALGEVRHRFVEPGNLIVVIGTDYATPHDMLKELVTSLFESARGARDLRLTGVLVGHALGYWERP